jgi:hypothetical protein
MAIERNSSKVLALLFQCWKQRSGVNDFERIVAGQNSQ